MGNWELRNKGVVKSVLRMGSAHKKGLPAGWRCKLSLDKVTAAHCKRRTSTRTSSSGCPKLFPISDNVSVVIQGVLVQHFRFLLLEYFTVHDFDFITKEFLEVSRIYILS